MPNQSNQNANFNEKEWLKFKQENFILDYFHNDWANVLQIDQQNVNLLMESFQINMSPIMDTHAL